MFNVHSACTAVIRKAHSAWRAGGRGGLRHLFPMGGGRATPHHARRALPARRADAWGVKNGSAYRRVPPLLLAEKIAAPAKVAQMALMTQHPRNL